MSIPKINTLSVAEINAAMAQVTKLAENMAKKNFSGSGKIVYGPPGPVGKRGEVGPVGPEPAEGMNLELLFNNGLI
jgi:hypothetical protein